MGKMSSISRTLTLAAVAIAIALCSASLSMAQTDSRSDADRARDDQKILKSNIDQPQTKLSQIKSAQYGHITSLGVSAARNDKGCCVGGPPWGAFGTMGSNEPPQRGWHRHRPRASHLPAQVPNIRRAGVAWKARWRRAKV